MKRMTTLVAVIGFTFFAAPLAAAADPHEGKADVNENSNAQWSDGAKKGQERADEVKNRAEHDAHRPKAT
jgi:Ni/Co efflux regulator RcnB